VPRAFIIVLDSVGCGGAADAADYGDTGANTIGHIAQHCADGRGNLEGLRSGPLTLPHLEKLGLAHAAQASINQPVIGLVPPATTEGQWGYAVERSFGKDTPSGHWEIAGSPVLFRWGYFADKENSFPPELTSAIIAQAAIAGILGNCHAPGTEIIERLGAEHLTTGKPIFYTSVDSVIQIAAHEESFGLERLYALCKTVRKLVDDRNIGRVIARPFIGDARTGFVRTANRKDFAIQPPTETLLDRCATHGRSVITIGKVGDIFAHRHTGEEIKGKSNAEHIDILVSAMARLPEGGFCFTNLVDFDTEYGHRRDVPGYAACLEAFDRRLPAIRAALRPGDICIITADHGNDPTWQGTDHTREHVPVLCFGPGIAAGSIGQRETMADMAAKVGEWLGIGTVGPGKSW
jgi:phosphopentomutase